MTVNKTIWILICIIVMILAHGTCKEVDAQFTFGTPADIGPPVSIAGRPEYLPSIQNDGLSLYFAAAGGYGANDIWEATRLTSSEDWYDAYVLDSTINSSVSDVDPEIADGGLSLYFASRRTGTSGGNDIWCASRPTLDDPWSTPVNVSSVNSPFDDRTPNISADGLSLYFSRAIQDVPESGDIYMSTRADASESWEEPVKLGANINSEMADVSPVISPNGLSLFFASNRYDPNAGYKPATQKDLQTCAHGARMLHSKTLTGIFM